MNAPDKIKSPFETLSAINVNEHVEKKNGLSYLSWPFAVSELMKADPSANWVFNEPINFGETMMVSCTVTAFGKAITMHLPVMDHRNQAIKNPDAFAVNKNMMRCLVKAIACHGLGLYIYAGEDLPEAEEKPAPKKGKGVIKPTDGAMESLSPDQQIAARDDAEYIIQLWDGGDKGGAYEAWMTVGEGDNTYKVAVWSVLGGRSDVRNGLKKIHDEQKETAHA